MPQSEHRSGDVLLVFRLLCIGYRSTPLKSHDGRPPSRCVQQPRGKFRKLFSEAKRSAFFHCSGDGEQPRSKLEVLLPGGAPVLAALLVVALVLGVFPPRR
jgi:hypothetical protein